VDCPAAVSPRVCGVGLPLCFGSRRSLIRSRFVSSKPRQLLLRSGVRGIAAFSLILCRFFGAGQLRLTRRWTACPAIIRCLAIPDQIIVLGDKPVLCIDVILAVEMCITGWQRRTRTVVQIANLLDARGAHVTFNCILHLRSCHLRGCSACNT